MSKGVRWTREQKEFLIENYGIISVRKISAVIDKTPKQIYDYASLLRSKGIINDRLDNNKKYKEDIFGG